MCNLQLGRPHSSLVLVGMHVVRCSDANVTVRLVEAGARSRIAGTPKASNRFDQIVAALTVNALHTGYNDGDTLR